jgi:6-pyruvoyltetrahydropterin/6-carboxytetrahydropterin synthase
VRICVNPPAAAAAELAAGRHNTFAGWPTMVGIGAWYEIVVGCRGPADPGTGWLMSIAEIDRAVRAVALPVLRRALWGSGSMEPGPSLAAIVRGLHADLGLAVAWVAWRLTPYYSVRIEARRMDRVSIAQQFEFAASHRLHSPHLSPEENRRLYGKCNHPGGHGHNYRLEVSVSRALDAGLALAELEKVVDERVVARFDHRNLNTDVPEFAGRNPSVEEIARVCFDLLAGPLASAGAVLERVTVWETEKTSATFAPDR